MLRKIKRYNDFVNEDHAQQNIPFEEPEYAGKSVHEHLLDALQDLQVMKSSAYFSDKDPETCMAKSRDKAIKRLLDENEIYDAMTDFMAAYDPNEDTEYYTKEFLDENDEYIKEREWLNVMDNVMQVADIQKNVISKEGWPLFMKQLDETFDNLISDMDYAVSDAYDNDESGLIDCWRTVKYTKGDEDDIYSDITKNFGGVGVYWTWDRDKAEAYWAGSAGHSITLIGKVSTNDVDWEETMYKSAYNLREEREIRIKDQGAVMVTGFHDDVIDKEYIFDEPFVVKTTKGKIYKERE